MTEPTNDAFALEPAEIDQLRADVAEVLSLYETGIQEPPAALVQFLEPPQEPGDGRL